MIAALAAATCLLLALVTGGLTVLVIVEDGGPWALPFAALLAFALVVLRATFGRPSDATSYGALVFGVGTLVGVAVTFLGLFFAAVCEGGCEPATSIALVVLIVGVVITAASVGVGVNTVVRAPRT